MLNTIGWFRIKPYEYSLIKCSTDSNSKVTNHQIGKIKFKDMKDIQIFKDNIENGNISSSLSKDLVDLLKQDIQTNPF